MMLQGSQGGLKFPTPTLLNTASLPAPGQALGSLRRWGRQNPGANDCNFQTPKRGHFDYEG